MAALVFALVALLGCVLFWLLREIPSDIANHNSAAWTMWTGEGAWQPNFLYFAVLAALGGALGDGPELMLSSSLLLGVALGLKAAISFTILSEGTDCRSLRPPLAATVVMLVAFAIPVGLVLGRPYFYLGYLTPNVWHNSTTIALMPIALATFRLQVMNFEEPTIARTTAVAALVALGVLVKPSFFFAYAPATLIHVALRRDGLAGMAAAFPVGIGGALTAGLFVAIFVFQQGALYEGDSSVIFAPMRSWSYFLGPALMPVVAVSGFLAPILFAVMRLVPRHRTAWVYAVQLALVSMAIFLLFAEEGPRARHGNFYWQVVICSYILHLVLLRELLIAWARPAARMKVALCGAVYAAMALSGIAYLARLLFFGQENFL